MKAIVTEILSNGEAVVLRDDGIFVNVNIGDVAIGSTIDMDDADGMEDKTSRRGFRIPGWAYSMAAALAIIIFAGGLFYTNDVMAVAYVTMDINPSIEFSLNSKDRVVLASALNEDAQPVVDRLCENDIKGMEISEAVELTLRVLEEYGYITDEGEAYLLFSVVSDKESTKTELTSVLADIIDSADTCDVSADIVTAGTKDRKDAAKEGISTGKYMGVDEDTATHAASPSSSSDDKASDEDDGVNTDTAPEQSVQQEEATDTDDDVKNDTRTDEGGKSADGNNISPNAGGSTMDSDNTPSDSADDKTDGNNAPQDAGSSSAKSNDPFKDAGGNTVENNDPSQDAQKNTTENSNSPQDGQNNITDNNNAPQDPKEPSQSDMP